MLICLTACGGVNETTNSDDNSDNKTSTTSLPSNPTNNGNDVTNTPTSGETASPSAEPSESATPSEEPSNEVTPTQSPTVQNGYRRVTIKGAHALCNKITSTDATPNKEGSDKVTFKGKMLFVEDIGTTSEKNGYSSKNQYQAFLFDNEDWIYVGISSKDYSNLSKYEFKDNEYLEIKGTTHKYHNQDEIVLDSYEWLGNNSGLNYSFENLISNKNFDLKTIGEIIQKDKTEPLNIKGTNFGDEVTHFKGKYIQKVENAVALFASGDDYILVHSTSKLNNNFTIGKTYDIYGVYNMFIYRPQFEFVHYKVISEEINVNEYPSNTLSGTSLYQIKYTKDTMNHSVQYENIFGKAYSYEGYINYYQKGSYYYFVLDDYDKDPYQTYTNAMNAKTMFVNNSDEEKIETAHDLSYSELGKHYGEKIKVSFVPYLKNTVGYWQVQLLIDTLTVIE